MAGIYIGSQWLQPTRQAKPVLNPASESEVGAVVWASPQEVDRAVVAAQSALESFARTSPQERRQLLSALSASYRRYSGRLADAVTREIGAPQSLSVSAQVPAGQAHIDEAARVLESFDFDMVEGSTCIRREPVGVVGLITPWNWPLNQILCKVAPALAAGCTIVLKPSEIAPLSACILADCLTEAGVPSGVFNLVTGDAQVGAALASHPGVDMISLTGSTRAGREVSKLAADTIKRVTLELGGKSACIILDDTALEPAIAETVYAAFVNSGQTCNAPTRLLVPAPRYSDALEVAAHIAQAIPYATIAECSGGSSLATSEVDFENMQDDIVHGGFALGPVAGRPQFESVQAFIRSGIQDGAALVAGGLGRPKDYDRGFFVQPTVFGVDDPHISIAREEIFGPVLTIIPYRNDDDAIRIANDSIYGLSAFVRSSSLERARSIARRLRTGMVHINGAPEDIRAPFGGCKQSGNGREWGRFGLEEFLETKAIMGWS